MLDGGSAHIKPYCAVSVPHQSPRTASHVGIYSSHSGAFLTPLQLGPSHLPLNAAFTTRLRPRLLVRGHQVLRQLCRLSQPGFRTPSAGAAVHGVWMAPTDAPPQLPIAKATTRCLKSQHIGRGLKHVFSESEHHGISL